MIAESLENINLHNICIAQGTKNNIITDGMFYKLLYSNNLYISNGIYILISLHDRNHTILYDKFNNQNYINKIYNIENYILTNINNIDNKKLQYKTYEYFNNDYIKKYNKYTDKLILKLSGVWENHHFMGISYKIITVNETLIFN